MIQDITTDLGDIKFYQTFNQEIMPISYKLLWKIEKWEILAHLFYEADITLILKPNKNITDNENHKPISLVNIGCKNPKQNKSKSEPMF